MYPPLWINVLGLVIALWGGLRFGAPFAFGFMFGASFVILIWYEGMRG